MTNVTVLGIDLAKNVFQLHGADEKGNAVMKKKVTRANLLKTVAKLQKCRIVMEACGGANHWARQFEKHGHTVQLISPQYVKPFVKTNKNDANDAEAIVEADSRPSMNYVAPKSIAEQDIQSLHRIHSKLVKDRTALSNQIRGLLLEYGIAIPQSMANLRKRLPQILEEENELTEMMKEQIQDMYDDLKKFDARIKKLDGKIESVCNADERCKRISEIKGIGVLTATAIVAAAGDGKHFKNGRQFAAWLGLVPRQNSSGGKNRLLGISKRGDTYLRTLLIHGARTTLRYVDKGEDKRCILWTEKKKRLGANKAAVALANKNARAIWALLSSGEAFEENRYAKAA